MHEDYEFQCCPLCGGPLKSRLLKDSEPERLVCSECGFIFYLDPKLVACTVVDIDGRIVLLKRAVAPNKGKWVLPGGYVDRGEEVKAAALRETEEECGIKSRIKRLLGVYSYPGRIGVVVVYVVEYLSGDLQFGDESLGLKMFSPEEIPWETLAFPSTVDALKDYIMKGKGPDGKDQTQEDMR